MVNTANIYTKILVSTVHSFRNNAIPFGKLNSISKLYDDKKMFEYTDNRINYLVIDSISVICGNSTTIRSTVFLEARPLGIIGLPKTAQTSQ